MSVHEMKGKHTIFIFFDTELVDTKRFLENLLKFDQVVEAHVISGQYDVLAVMEIDLHGRSIFASVQEVATETIEKIRKLKGVRDTNTIVPFFSVTKRPE